jgi:hypothetical protein
VNAVVHGDEKNAHPVYLSAVTGSAWDLKKELSAFSV